MVHSFSNGPVDLNGSIHWNVIGLYNEILIGLSKSQVEYGSSIQSIGVDSWGLDYGHLDSDGHLLGLPYHYRDERTHPMVDLVASIVGRASAL